MKTISDDSATGFEAHYGTEPGLTKREHIAALALQGILVNRTSPNTYLAASEAVKAADLLIARLNETSND